METNSTIEKPNSKDTELCTVESVVEVSSKDNITPEEPLLNTNTCLQLDTECKSTNDLSLMDCGANDQATSSYKDTLQSTNESAVELLKHGNGDDKDLISITDTPTMKIDVYHNKEDLEDGLNLQKRLQDDIDHFKQEKNALENEIMNLRRIYKSEKDEKLDEMSKLKTMVIALKQEKESLSMDMCKYQHDVVVWIHNLGQTTQQAICALERTCQRDSQEKRELLSEMTSMNEELNRRGETISSLKEVVSMYEKKVIELNTDQDFNLSTIKSLREELTDRTQRLHDLTIQQETNSNIMSQLRDELSNTCQRLQDLDDQQNESNNTIKHLRDELEEVTQRLQSTSAELARTRDHPIDGDQASTSTVSRVEESARLRDVEDSFEDRYCKLKVVAAKLKKRATETQQLLDSERQKWTTERSEMINKLNQLTSSARNLQTVQQECDRIGDELETERKECKMLRKAATDAKASEVNLKVKLEEAQTNIEILKVNLDAAIKERDSAAQTLAAKQAELDGVVKEKLAEELVKKEKAKEVSELEDRLKEEQEKLSEMQKVVESAKMEARKQSVLSLEIQNYEKSLSDMNSQVHNERARVSSLEAEVQTLQDIRDSLQEQIRLLEESVAMEETRSHQAHDEVVNMRQCLQRAESSAQSLESQVSQLTARLESERASAEAATLELASLSSAVQSNTDIMLKEKQDLSVQVGTLSSQLATVKTQLEQKEEELGIVRADFEKYKVRAQSVLRKHQSSGVSQAEAEAKEQAEQLRTLADTLRDKLAQSACEVEKLQSELAMANSEREAAETRCVNLNMALADKTKQLERATAEHRSQKLSLDTLVNCYKTQLEDKEKAMEEQVSSLTQEVESLKSRLSEPRPAQSEAVSVEAAPARTELPLHEREDGEGSEYLPEYSPCGSPIPAPKPLLPLDKLLETNDNLHGEREQMDSLRGELERSRKRAQHQAALLADTEQDAARKEQLIAVLKKEIGRLERCIERQPHAQNTEYLKNIVFKFVTLDTGEDRLRLVPVITTLLQLSPEETNRLSAVARGQSPDAGGGWGSYFGGWR